MCFLKPNWIKKHSERIGGQIPGTRIELGDALKLFRDQILKCKVIYVTVKSFEDAYAIFEVLNAKGKDLSPVDIIKNSIFSILDETEPVDTAYNKWGNIREYMADGRVDDIVTFYRHFWLSKYGLTQNRKLVNEFNKKIRKDQYSYQTFLDELETAASDYAKISQPSSLFWPQPEDRIIFEINCTL